MCFFGNKYHPLLLYGKQKLGHSGWNGIGVFKRFHSISFYRRMKSSSFSGMKSSQPMTQTASLPESHAVEIEFSCRYEKKNNISLEFTARRHITTITEKGFGTLTYSFGLFTTENYHTEIDVIAYPAEYELGDMIYMQIESQSSINSTELFVESCVATPYNDPNYQTSYAIIQNG